MPGLITRRRREPARTETRGTESQDWAGKTNTIINDRNCNIKWIKTPSAVSRVPDDETHNSDHICMINERGSLQSTSWSNNLLNIKAAQTSVGLKLFTSSHYTFNWTFLSISWPQWECFPATKDLNPRLKKTNKKLEHNKSSRKLSHSLHLFTRNLCVNTHASRFPKHLIPLVQTIGLSLSRIVCFTQVSSFHQQAYNLKTKTL